MDQLRVRVYNVLFGDAILITVPDRSPGGSTEKRHILIDVGNVLSGRGGDDSVFERVVHDILKELDGAPVDLYIMTHEHMDHVQGLLHASVKFNLNVKARYAWLTASSALDYYDLHPKAKEKRLNALAIHEAISQFLAASSDTPNSLLQALLFNNSRSTKDCVDHLRGIAEKLTYVFRGCDLNDAHPFQEAQLHLWGPEEDTAEYYGAFHPMALGLSPATGPDTPLALTMPSPPSGVDASAFYSLVEMRRLGYTDNLLAIDRAANNTSIVFCLEWRGWRLLFPGDAELRSWQIMDRNRMLDRPVDFLKVGHHGSANGTPPAHLLDKLLPIPSPNGRRARAVVSTCAGSYHGVPDSDTMTEIGRRCDLQSVEELRDDTFYIDVSFEG